MRDSRYLNWRQLSRRFASEGFECVSKREAVDHLAFCQKCRCQTVWKADYKRVFFDTTVYRTIYVCVECNHKQKVGAADIVQRRMF